MTASRTLLQPPPLGLNREDGEAMLGRAFEEDPLIVHATPDADAERRRATAARIQGGVLRYALRYGKVDYLSDMGALAIWLPPEEPHMTLPRMIRTGALAVPFALGFEPVRRLWRYSRVKEALRREATDGPHWYLLILAVDPQRQHSGVGRTLLGLGLARADAGWYPSYLETLKEENVSFFERHGFKVKGSAWLPNGGPRVWAMVRPPRGARARVAS